MSTDQGSGWIADNSSWIEGTSGSSGGTSSLSPDFSEPQTCEGSAQLQGYETYKVAKLCEVTANADDVNSILTAISNAIDTNQCWMAVAAAFKNGIPYEGLVIPVPGPDVTYDCLPVVQNVKDALSAAGKHISANQPVGNQGGESPSAWQQFWDWVASLFGGK